MASPTKTVGHLMAGGKRRATALESEDHEPVHGSSKRCKMATSVPERPSQPLEMPA